MRLNKENCHKLPGNLRLQADNRSGRAAIIHFGVGAFHRSHQAYVFQQLAERFPAQASHWQVCGICIRKEDEDFVKAFRKQDLLYSLSMCGEPGADDVRVMNVISEVFWGPENPAAVVERISLPETKIISFTITEGGYNIDEATGMFDLQHPAIVADLDKGNPPQTVFGYLARALELRAKQGLGNLVLMSCDNIQENGTVLRHALESFLQVYNKELLDYTKQFVSYPNSMVDRITPVAAEGARQAFESVWGYRDECLVISEKFFQWVLEAGNNKTLSPLAQAGVTLVDDVRPYEFMKLGILNGGHSLIGLIGHSLGYTYINEAVRDKQVQALFRLYTKREVIPTLQPIDGVDYIDYAKTVENRFGNPLIKDTVMRILSGSTAKIPKFVLPVIKECVKNKTSCRVGALVLVSWWFYLHNENRKNGMADVDDVQKNDWSFLSIKDASHSAQQFIERRDFFGSLSDDADFVFQCRTLAEMIQGSGMRQACTYVIDQYLENS